MTISVDLQERLSQRLGIDFRELEAVQGELLGIIRSLAELEERAEQEEEPAKLPARVVDELRGVNGELTDLIEQLKFTVCHPGSFD